MRFDFRFPEADKTFRFAIRKINSRLGRNFAQINVKSAVSAPAPFGFPRPFNLDTQIGGIYMKDEGWSNLHQCETSPQFWVYIDGSCEVLHVKSGSKGVEFKKVLAVPSNKKVYRLL